MTQTLARAMVGRGHGVRVIGVCARGYSGPDREVDQGVHVWRLRPRLHRFGWVADRHRLWRIVASWSHKGEISLVEVPDWEGPAAWWPRLPVPVIARLHGSGSYFAAELRREMRRTTFWLERASLRRADVWCAVSDYAAEKARSLFGLSPDRQTVLHNAVDPPASTDLVPRSRTKVVFSGSLTQRKGVISLVEAWSTVIALHRQAELHIYGKDTRDANGRSMQEWLGGLLDESGRATVCFHGHVGREQVLNALCEAAIAVFPSYAEAFALAPLEAMMVGCPTIYTHRGSGPELIRHGVDGLLIDPDSPAEIAGAICRLLDDRAEAARLGAAGAERARKAFSTEVLVPRNEAFYETCVRTFRRNRVTAGSER
jgi:glycogen(starch) synthase